MKPFYMLMSFGLCVASLIFIMNLPSYITGIGKEFLIIFPFAFLALGIVAMAD